MRSKVFGICCVVGLLALACTEPPVKLGDAPLTQGGGGNVAQVTGGGPALTGGTGGAAAGGVIAGSTATAGASDAETGGAATGGAATGGAATGGAATGGAETGGAETGGASAADCAELTSALQSAFDAFAPVTPNSCILDSDCVVVYTWQVTGGSHQGCWGVSTMHLAGRFLDCPIVVASQWGAEWTAFLANDPAITAACDALRNAGCAPRMQTCPCFALDPGVCGSPTCVSGVCQ
jgi:hypothetical protein